MSKFIFGGEDPDNFTPFNVLAFADLWDDGIVGGADSVGMHDRYHGAASDGAGEMDGSGCGGADGCADGGHDVHPTVAG